MGGKGLEIKKNARSLGLRGEMLKRKDFFPKWIERYWRSLRYQVIIKAQLSCWLSVGYFACKLLGVTIQIQLLRVFCITILSIEREW